MMPRVRPSRSDRLRNARVAGAAGQHVMEMGIGLRIGDGAESRARRQGRPDDVGGRFGGGPARIEQFRALVPGAFDEDRHDAEGPREGRGIGDVEAEQGATGSLAEGQPLEIGLHGDPQGTARPDVVEEIEALRTAGETVSGHVRRGQARDGRLQRGVGQGQGADGLGLRPVDTALHGAESLADGGVAGADRGQFDADTAEQGSRSGRRWTARNRRVRPGHGRSRRAGRRDRRGHRRNR